jgi:hypothetical protein
LNPHSHWMGKSPLPLVLNSIALRQLRFSTLCQKDILMGRQPTKPARDPFSDLDLQRFSRSIHMSNVSAVYASQWIGSDAANWLQIHRPCLYWQCFQIKCKRCASLVDLLEGTWVPRSKMNKLKQSTKYRLYEL